MALKFVMLRCEKSTRWLRRVSVAFFATLILVGCSPHPPVITEQVLTTLTIQQTFFSNIPPTSTKIANITPGERITIQPSSTTVFPASTLIPTRSVFILHVELLTQLCWVAYSPTHFDPTQSPIQYPTEDEVIKDLQVLYKAGFTGLVTYAANYRMSDQLDQFIDIPKLAQEAGFNGMIMGVWDPTDDAELRAAEMASQSPIIIGYSVGNEGLDERYDLNTLTAAMEHLRYSTNKPVTTTEQVNDYYRSSPLWEISDWIFPNVHPYFSGIYDPKEAVEWTVKIFENLSKFSEKDLLFKEVGLPSGGDTGLSEYNQASYYQMLRKTLVNYVVFEAFDAPWKHLGKPDENGRYLWPDPEPHWGVFTSTRSPKPAVTGICLNH